ncbi:hypothetical protein [Enterococcus sp. BWR-S5]|uniref:hypothetical protein n=1 Tax=Enterococcus sp. BWR-S5 TaxID=2787714 RepID=UPI001F38F127|nr:hypothetical protein [Enterococcus sp. BWR-S5]
MKKYLVILSLVFLTACKNHNEDTSSISTSTVESQQTSNPPEAKVDNQITTTTPDELLGDWKVNNKGFGIEVLEEKVVFYIGDSRAVSEDYYIDNPTLLHAYFSFEYAGVKYDQVSIEKTGYSEYFSKSEGIMTMFAKDGQTASYNVRRVSGEDDEPVSGQTIDERIDSFIATYTAIPPDWYLEKEDGGITIHATSYTASDEQGASSILSNLTGISNTVTEQVGADVPLRLLEPGQTDFSVILMGGQVIRHNEIFGEAIK